MAPRFVAATVGTLEDLSLEQLRQRVRWLVAGDDALTDVVFRAMRKFHQESACGGEGGHWHECSGLVTACGYASWEAWVQDVRDQQDVA